MLPETPARAFLAVLPPDLVATMEQLGCELQPRTRPIRSPGGALAVRLVFRMRETGVSVVVTAPHIAPAMVADA